jgi:hypothetical protein
LKKWRGGEQKKIAGIADIAEIGKAKTYHGGTRDMENSQDRKKANRENLTADQR